MAAVGFSFPKIDAQSSPILEISDTHPKVANGQMRIHDRENSKMDFHIINSVRVEIYNDYKRLQNVYFFASLLLLKEVISGYS